MSEIVLGMKIRDKVSGLKGIATARVVYLNGCVQYCLAPKARPDALEINSYYIDESQLEIIGDGIVNELNQKGHDDKPAVRTGGFAANTPKGAGRPPKY